MSCGYQGRHFGANYPDGACIDGYLWDLDSCDGPGGDLTWGGDTPCPRCQPLAFVNYHYFQAGGNAKQRRVARRALARKVLARAQQECK